MNQRKLICSRIVLFLYVMCTCFSSFAMDLDLDGQSSRKKRATDLYLDEESNPYEAVDLSFSTDSTTTPTTTKNTDYRGKSRNRIDIDGNDYTIIDIDSYDKIQSQFSVKYQKNQQERGEELKQAELYLEKMLEFSDMDLDFEHPLQKAIVSSLEKDGNTFSKSSILGYYKYGDPEKYWDAPSLFFKELDRGFFIRPISKKTRAIQIVLGAIGLTVPYAWSPLVLYLSQQYLTFIPVAGDSALALFTCVYLMSAPPCGVQGWKMGGEIGDAIFEANGFTAKSTDEDKKPHMQPSEFPILSRVFSVVGSFQRTLPYPLLYWKAEKYHRFIAAFFISQFSSSIFKRAYDDSMNFWDRLAQNRRDPLIAFEIKNLTESLMANKELINKNDSDDLVKLLYMSMAKEIKTIELYNKDRKKFHEKLENLLSEEYNLIQTELSEVISDYVQKSMGISKVSRSSQNIIFSTIEKEIKRSKETLDQKKNSDEESCNCCCFKTSMPNMVKDYHKNKERNMEFHKLFKKIDDYLQKTIRKLKIEIALNEKNELCVKLKQDLLSYFTSTTTEELGFPNIFYKTISEYVKTKKETQSQGLNETNALEKRIKRLIADSFTKILTAEIIHFIEKRTNQKPKEILTAKLCNAFKSKIENQDKNQILQRSEQNEQLLTLITNYLKTALCSFSVMKTTPMQDAVPNGMIAVFPEGEKLYYQFGNNPKCEIMKAEYSRVTEMDSKTFVRIYNDIKDNAKISKADETKILHYAVIEELNELAKKIKKKSENTFLWEENRDALIDNVYICIQKELGNVILKNGLAVHEEDVAMSAFSMLLRKLEMPNIKSLRDDHAELVSILEGNTEENIQEEKKTEKTSLLGKKKDKKKKKSKALEIVKSMSAEKAQAFMDLLANSTPTFAKTFLHNLSIFDQGDAKNGRYIMAVWAATTLLKTYFGISPEVTLALSLTYGGIDALLRPIQEWYLQKDTYASVREIFSTIDIDSSKPSASVNIDYWPLRALTNVASGVASCFFSLPTFAIIAEMMPTTDLWIKALIISAATRGDIVSCCHFFREQWNDIIRGGAETTMAFYETDITLCGCNPKSVWNVTVSQMRAWLNDIFDRAMRLIPKLNDFTIKELHADTQGTH